MDAALYGFHPAHRQEWDSSGAGGAVPPPAPGESGGAPRPPATDEAPNTEFFAKQNQLHLSDEALAGLGILKSLHNPI